MTHRSIMAPASILCLLLSQMALADMEKPIIAVFDIDGGVSGIRKRVLSELTNYLSVKLAEGGYEVIPRDQIRKRLLSQKKSSYKECFDQSCQIELGRELAAQKSLSIRIMKIGRTCKVTATLYDLKKSTAELGASAGGSCKPEALPNAIDNIAEQLCEPLRAKQKESDKAISDFDRVLKDAQKSHARENRVRNAWLAVQGMASNPNLPKSTRSELLQKFLAEFTEDNPYRKEANSLLMKLLPGTLVVNTVPENAVVTIDGYNNGKSPLTLRIPAGQYKVNAMLEGYEGNVQTANIRPGVETKITIQMVDRRPGELVVNTLPEGASVTIGNSVFEAPAKTSLRAGQYSVTAFADGFHNTQKLVNVSNGNTTEITISLNRDYPMNPYKKWGHTAMWTGLGLAAFGGVALSLGMSAADDHEAGDVGAQDTARMWTGLMYTGFGAGGALMITGVVLWALSPGDREWFEKNSASVAAIPTTDGMVLSLGGRW